MQVMGVNHWHTSFICSFLWRHYSVHPHHLKMVPHGGGKKERKLRHHPLSKLYPSHLQLYSAPPTQDISLDELYEVASTRQRGRWRFFVMWINVGWGNVGLWSQKICTGYQVSRGWLVLHLSLENTEWPWVALVCMQTVF